MENVNKNSGFAQLCLTRNAGTPDWSDMRHTDHFVQFYDLDNFIETSIAQYIIRGLGSGHTCILAITRDHLIEVEKAISFAVSDLKEARREGRYLPLDAGELLSRFMREGMPDPKLFESTVGILVEEAVQRGGEIRVFGEMVGVLASERNYAAAISLEALWDDLREKYVFSLFCAYPMSGLADSSAGEHMSRICDGHTRVIPAESYTLLATSEKRLSAVASMQQRSRQLETEMPNRKTHSLY